MHRTVTRLTILLSMCLGMAGFAYGQEPTSVDPQLQAWETAKVPREYTIGKIVVTGVRFLDTAIVSSISGLQPGEKITHPGGDKFSKAIQNIWRQRLFSDVQIYVTHIDGDIIDLEIAVQERPKLGAFKFVGAKKTEADELKGKIGLAPQTIITESIKKNAVEIIKKYYADKGFNRTTVKIEEKPDTAYVNSNALFFYIDKGRKVKINNITFDGNETVSDLRLKKRMKGTKERTRLTLHPSDEVDPFGVAPDRTSFRSYVKDYGFLKPSYTKNVLDPYIRIKLFSSAKFDQKKYEEDKQKVLDYLNSIGYRDATIVDDDTAYTDNGNLDVALKIEEGHKYYFGNIVWKGNTKYSDSILTEVLGIRKGDVYNSETLNSRLRFSQDGSGDVSSLYQDDGYLFFNTDVVETRVYNDTIDFEIRLTEGIQARIKNVNISGNEKTKDYVIRRELRTVPGELFRRSDLIRSQRELANLQYFNQETINPDVRPNTNDGTVDINWQLEEKSSDQLELSAGWGGGIGLTGTLGVTFNNFSAKNLFNKKAWDPLPMGDGQKLSLRLQSNGRAYRSYNFSFTEPWLGGKKRNSFTISYYNSKFSNAYFYNSATGRYEISRERSDTTYLKSTGVGVSLGKQLNWPDDYFSLIYSVNYTRYQLRNYNGLLRDKAGNYIDSGTSNTVSFKLALQRSSVFDPIFPRSGSNFLASVQFTPPYSLFDPAIEKSSDPYKLPEYHKWRFNAEWYVPLGKAMGEQKDHQFVLKLAAKYGFMGRYNKRLDFSPFERFQVGDAGLTNNFGLLGYDIIAHRGYPVYESSDPTINPDQQNASNYFTIFNKYQLELRYPLVTNPSSTIYGLTFFEAANGWFDFKDYNPFRLRRSVGVGMRFFLPMFGLLGFDYGIGLDRLQPGGRLKDASRFTFMLGFEPE